MPMIRIVTAHTYSAEQKSQISDLTQFCMENYFNTPKNDRFHFFQQLKSEDIIIDANYWVEKQRTSQFILFNITAGKPRSPEQKAEFMHELTNQLNAKFQIPKQDIMIVIQYNQLEDWSFGEGVRGDILMEKLVSQ